MNPVTRSSGGASGLAPHGPTACPEACFAGKSKIMVDYSRTNIDFHKLIFLRILVVNPIFGHERIIPVLLLVTRPTELWL